MSGAAVEIFIAMPRLHGSGPASERRRCNFTEEEYTLSAQFVGLCVCLQGGVERPKVVLQSLKNQEIRYFYKD